jgi:hypothetical protein
VRLAEACMHSFSRHETFYPRYGWFKKALDGASKDPRIFCDPAATISLGVGKNMVRAIRFWGLAAKILTAGSKASSSIAASVYPTRVGNAILGSNGLDPFVEDPGTTWLLHWLLLAPPCLLPVWWLAFNEFPGVSFDEAELLDFLGKRLSAFGWNPSPSSLQKDIQCLLLSYTLGKHSRGEAGPDDSLDCPFRVLGLLRRSGYAGREIRFNFGGKPTLPSEIATFACLDFVSRTDRTARTTTINRLASEPGSPGRVFKLSESSLVQALEEASKLVPVVEVIGASGSVQLAWKKPLEESARILLLSYYRRSLSESEVVLGLLGREADEPV